MGDILFSDICDKISVLLAEHSFRYRTGKQYDKYAIISVNEGDKSVVVIDRESDYSVFKLPYKATETKEGLVVNIDYENKTAMALGVVQEATSPPVASVFSVKDEVETISKDVSEYDVGIYSNAKINDLMSKLEEMTGNYEASKTRIGELEGHLGVFENEKKKFLSQKHRDIIDTLIASRREEMGKYSEYLEYCIEIDYSKSIEQVEKEIKEIHYNFMLKSQPGGKKSFSAIEVPVATGFEGERNVLAERYGEDIAKYF